MSLKNKSADHSRGLDLIINNGLVLKHFVTDIVLNVLFLFILSNHKVILSHFLRLLTLLDLPYSGLAHLPLEDTFAELCVQLVSSLLLLVLLLLHALKEIALVLVSCFKGLLLLLTSEESCSSVVMDLHHLLLFNFNLLLFFLELFILN